jgi:glycosyltransferase involved in cell wall biosynthesis
MNLLCLMPTYGRRASLLENSIQLFLDQDYPNKTLLIFDDLGTLATTEPPNSSVLIMSTIKRSNSIGAKYNLMMQHASEYDGVIVWDDDDIYLPHHLSAHAAVLDNHQWSKPDPIISSYFLPPREEVARGRFHGSIGIRVDFLKYLFELTGSMWIDTRRATFDQEMLQKLSHHSVAGNPTHLFPPSYVYRWQTTLSGHCSGLMGDEDWYEKYQPDSKHPIEKLFPHYDEDTIRTLQYLQSVYQ